MRGESSVIRRVHPVCAEQEFDTPHAHQSSLRTDTGAYGPNQQVWRTLTLYTTEYTTKMAVSIDRVVAGIDVGKRNLDVSVNTGRPRRFANTEAGIARLLAWAEEPGGRSGCVRTHRRV